MWFRPHRREVRQHRENGRHESDHDLETQKNGIYSISGYPPAMDGGRKLTMEKEKANNVTQ